MNWLISVRVYDMDERGVDELFDALATVAHANDDQVFCTYERVEPERLFGNQLRHAWRVIRRGGVA